MVDADRVLQVQGEIKCPIEHRCVALLDEQKFTKGQFLEMNVQVMPQTPGAPLSGFADYRYIVMNEKIRGFRSERMGKQGSTGAGPEAGARRCSRAGPSSVEHWQR